MIDLWHSFGQNHYNLLQDNLLQARKYENHGKSFNLRAFRGSVLE